MERLIFVVCCFYIGLPIINRLYREKKIRTEVVFFGIILCYVWMDSSNEKAVTLATLVICILSYWGIRHLLKHKSRR